MEIFHSSTWVVMYGCESWTIKKAEWCRIDAFELWCLRRLLRVPWTARRPNQSILKEINPEYSLEGLILKLKLQYFGHLMRRANSLENTLMLGKTCSPPGSSLHGILQARILEWVVILGDLPDPVIEPGSPTLQADALTSEPPGKTARAERHHWYLNNSFHVTKNFPMPANNKLLL